MARRRVLKWIFVALASLLAIGVVAALAMGPAIAWEVLSHGPTTVWDHLEYPTRTLDASPHATPWPTAAATDIGSLPNGPEVLDALETGKTLAFLVVNDGQIIGEWYRDDHGAATPSMLFSASKSILSLMIGAAIDDGLIDSVNDSVTEYVPELADKGFSGVTLEDLLHMDSSMDYVEDDNPFGIHIPFNYIRDLRGAVLDLEVREEPDPEFRYKSGDNALLGLALERSLEGESLTGYLERRLWDPLGATNTGSWNVDDEDGFERTWCCLAITARDFARFGQLVAEDGTWGGEDLISTGWLEASFTAGYTEDRWPEDYSGSPLANYGYQWWLLDDGSPLAFGKAGQYLYVDREDDVVIVRLGEDQGDVAWIDLVQALADSL